MMKTIPDINYQRIATAISFIRSNFKDQPNLEQVAEQVHLSPYHFQRLFTEWAGTSPKKFLQYISVEHAKKILREGGPTLQDAAFETGLSGSSRLHDLFVTIEGMSPAEFKNGGRSLSINYSFAETQFGKILVASTGKGICHLAFATEEPEALAALQVKFPNASYFREFDALQQNALFLFRNDWSQLDKIKLHLKATDFQLKVWETLLKIPSGHLSTYGMVAGKLLRPGASRAVGTAIGCNPVAFLIPCHRVIQSTGSFGQYHWGEVRKTTMIGWEMAWNQNT